jgi:hypothetical protein
MPAIPSRPDPIRISVRGSGIMGSTSPEDKKVVPPLLSVTKFKSATEFTGYAFEKPGVDVVMVKVPSKNVCWLLIICEKPIFNDPARVSPPMVTVNVPVFGCPKTSTSPSSLWELMARPLAAIVNLPKVSGKRGDEAGPETLKVMEVPVIENEPLVPGPKTMNESIKLAKLAPVRSSVSAMSARLIANLRAMVVFPVQIVFAFLVLMRHSLI